MCYGDMYHGDDGYYLEWAQQQELIRLSQLAEEEQWEAWMESEIAAGRDPWTKQQVEDAMSLQNATIKVEI